MDVELQVLKHLARDAQSTTRVIDEYCLEYKHIFKEVINYECFKYLHVGIISPIKRKSLPEIGKVVGMKSGQSLHHFITKSPWSTTEIKSRKFRKIINKFKEIKINISCCAAILYNIKMNKITDNPIYASQESFVSRPKRKLN